MKFKNIKTDHTGNDQLITRQKRQILRKSQYLANLKAVRLIGNLSLKKDFFSKCHST